MVKIIRVRPEYASRHPTFVQINKKLHAEQPISVHQEICELSDAVGTDDPAWFDPLSKNHPFPRPLNLELNQDDLEILYRLSKGMRIDGYPNISELKRKIFKADFRESHQEEIVAFRNLPENKARAVATTKRWKENNPEKTKRPSRTKKRKHICNVRLWRSTPKARHTKAMILNTTTRSSCAPHLFMGLNYF